MITRINLNDLYYYFLYLSIVQHMSYDLNWHQNNNNGVFSFCFSHKNFFKHIKRK